MYRFLSKFYPKKLKKNYTNLVDYSGIKVNADRFMGFIVGFGFLLALVVAFYSVLFFKIPFFISFPGFFFLFEIMVYFSLLLKADSKAKFVEKILPDVLHLMSSNLRAGFTTDRALLLSARDEFGPFKDEINQVGKEITMGKEISKALMDMAKKIKSERLNKTITLIVSGLKSGGELSSLLDQTAKNLRQEELVDNRIRANVMMYVIFIFSAICFGAPLLFGLSSFLVDVLTETLGGIDIPQEAGIGTALPMSFTEVHISSDFVVTFSIVFLITASVLGSLILGLIYKGKEREGIKFMPILIVISLIVFFLSRFAISNMLQGFFGF